MTPDYELREIMVKPTELLLDPGNPRITLKADLDTSVRTIAEIEEMQDYILTVIRKSEFHVEDLVRSIKNSGFLDVGNRMIVRQVDKSGKYLVLEGNRRLAAIRDISSGVKNVKDYVRESISAIKVQELVMESASADLEEELKFRLLGMIHVNGQLEWGAMERALYVYRTYEHELRKHLREGFVYVPDFSRPCAEALNMSMKAFRADLATFRVYAQLRLNGYKAGERDYSLISLAVKTRGMNNEYFELDPALLEFSPIGLKRFADLCIAQDEDESPRITNPTDFRAITHVYKNGTARDMEEVEKGALTPAEALERVNRRLDLVGFRIEIQKIEKKMAAIRVTDARGTEKEKIILRRIQLLAARMLQALEE